MVTPAAAEPCSAPMLVLPNSQNRSWYRPAVRTRAGLAVPEGADPRFKWLILVHWALLAKAGN